MKGGDPGEDEERKSNSAKKTPNITYNTDTFDNNVYNIHT
jgi:hypothetical protein